MSTPSVSDQQVFEQQYLTKNEEVSPDVIKRQSSTADLELMIPSSPIHVAEQKVTSARFDHRRKKSNGDDLNPFLSVANASEKHGLTQQDSTESQENDQHQRYESLAEFTKENLIKYSADG